MPTTTLRSSATLPGVVVVILLLLLSAVPVQAAARLQTITDSGSQQSGRWQVFPLNSAVRGADETTYTASWEGTGDVNLFLRDRNGKAIARSNGNARPEVIRYSGSTEPRSLAVLVSSGSAEYTVRVDASATAAPAPTPSPPRPSSGDYPGQPAPGSIYWGASIAGNADPAARHERHAGAPMGVRRTFYRWSQRTTSLIHHARNDVQAGRVPWVSVKPPSWRAMANGQHDAGIDAMLRALDELDGPVWLTVHHEPEGGGGVNSSDDPSGPSGHLAMNRRVRQRMNRLGTNNIALAPILMAWTWDPKSRRDVNTYWDASVYDFVGVDIYAQSGGTMLRPVWYDVRRWAGARGVDVAVAEWGLSSYGSSAASHMRDWYSAAVGSHNDGRGARTTALAVFDSDKSTSGDFRALRNQTLSTFRSLITGGPSTWQGE